MTESRTVRTPVTQWFGSRRQVRCEIERHAAGRLAIRVSDWTAEWDGWHAEQGIRIRSWGELIAVITAMVKAWFALLTSRHATRLTFRGRR
jgi:hypothetical protein